MQNLVVVTSTKDWPIEVPDCRVVTARDYLTNPEFSSLRNTRVFNLCRSYSYQSIGYYVSLLAAARGHKPMPSVSTAIDAKNISLVRFVSDDLDDLIQKSFRDIQSPEFQLSIYFGKNVAKRHDRLSSALFALFPAPFLRAQFRWSDRWQLVSIAPMSAGEIPSDHIDFALQKTKDYFAGKRPHKAKKTQTRYDVAILFNGDDPTRPSDERAIQRFVDAADTLEMSAEVISRNDYGRLAEFDGLFIRETTGVNHHTYRFARKAQAEGIVVVDDPDSILKCTNKVFLAELLDRHGVPSPKTRVVHSRNRAEVLQQIGLPIILKQPDSSFSLGVSKAQTAVQYDEAIDQLLEDSDLVIAQEYLPTEFDWRIGVLGGTALYACKYYMAPHHWQIARHGKGGKTKFGKVEALPLDMVPPRVLTTAVKSAGLIGDGLYGVDLKQVGSRCLVIEVNENPNLDSGIEDGVLKDELYLSIMRHFLERIELRKRGVKNSK